VEADGAGDELEGGGVRRPEIGGDLVVFVVGEGADGAVGVGDACKVAVVVERDGAAAGFDDGIGERGGGLFGGVGEGRGAAGDSRDLGAFRRPLAVVVGGVIGAAFGSVGVRIAGRVVAERLREVVGVDDGGEATLRVEVVGDVAGRDVDEREI